MTRFELIPTPTGDRRRIIFKAVPLSMRERVRRFARRLAGR